MKSHAPALRVRDDPEGVETYKRDHHRVRPEVPAEPREIAIQRM